MLPFSLWIELFKVTHANLFTTFGCLVHVCRQYWFNSRNLIVLFIIWGLYVRIHICLVGGWHVNYSSATTVHYAQPVSRDTHKPLSYVSNKEISSVKYMYEYVSINDTSKPYMSYTNTRFNKQPWRLQVPISKTRMYKSSWKRYIASLWKMPLLKEPIEQKNSWTSNSLKKWR